MTKIKLKESVCMLLLLFAFLWGSSTRASAEGQWEVLYTQNLSSSTMGTPVDPDPYGVFYHNGNLYISVTTTSYPHSQYNEKGKLFKYKKSGTSWLLDGTLIITDLVGSMNFSGFATDDTYIYAVNRSNAIYKINPATMKIESSITTFLNQIIAIAYDRERDAFWVCDNNNNSKVSLVNKQGTIVSADILVSQVGTTNYAITGLAYDDVSEGGPYLLSAASNYAGTNLAVISRWNLKTNAFEFNIQNVANVPGSPTGGNFMASIYLYSDLAIGKVVLAGISKQTNLLFGYNFSDLADPTTPSKVTNLTATPGTNGKLEVTLSWTNPSKKVNGDPLDALSSIKIYRNNALVHTVNSPVMGAAASWKDTTVSSGNVSYKLVPVNSVGEGLQATVKTFAGEDLPGKVGDLQLTKVGGSGKLTWTQPTTGINSGWINASSLKYKIVRYPDEVTLTESQAGTSFTDNTITELKSYYYKVIASTSKGEGESASSSPLVLGPALSLPWADDFDNADDLALWTIIDANNDGITWQRSSYMGNTTPPSLKYGYHKDNSGDDWLISPPLYMEAGKPYAVKWVFKSQSPNFEESHKVYLGTSPLVADQTIELGEYKLKQNTYSEYYIYIPSVQKSGEYHISWYANSAANASGLFIDDIRVQEVLPVDMEALSISGPQSLSVGAETSHTLKIRNNGQNDASKISVKLVDAFDNVLVTQTHQGTLKTNESAEVILNWSPVKEGDYDIRGIVSFADDMESTNDTVTYGVKVKPFGLIDLTIGEKSITSANTPFYFSFVHSMSQTLYFEDEINITGRIDSIRYHSNFSSAYNNRNVRIFMALTDKEEFTNKKWITQATPVFDGYIDFPAGESEVTIHLDRPFHYTGGNLMVMSVAPAAETTMSYGANFYSSPSDRPSRTLYRYTVGSPIFEYSSDGTSFQFQFEQGLENSPTSNFPVISFVINTEVGILKGVVTDGINPLKDAIVKIEGLDGVTTTTNASGEYDFRGVPVGTHTVVATKQGYAEQSVEDVLIAKNKETETNFTLSSLSMIKLEGSVVNSTGDPVADAAIQVVGYETYKTVSDSEGKFVIEDIYASRRYDISVRAAGYIAYQDELLVGEDDILHDAIVLESCTSSAPSNLTATMHSDGWYDISLSWTAPSGSGLLGYNLYVNKLLQTEDLITATTYTFTAPQEGNYLLEISAVWESACESARVAQSLEMPLDPCQVAVSEFPFIEGFESGMPACWEQEYVYGSEDWVIQEDNGSFVIDPYSGSFNIRLQNSISKSSTKLVSSKMDITDLTAPTLTFWRLAPLRGGLFDELRVFYKTSASAEWKLLGEYTTVADEWTMEVLDLPEPSDDYRIAFEGIIKWGHGIFLDEIKVATDICLPVTNLVYEQKAERKVLLSWERPDATRVSGYTVIRDGKTIAQNVQEPEYLDTDADVGSHTYLVKAEYNKSFCSESETVAVEVTTVEMCDPIDELKAVVTDCSTVSLTWNRPTAVNLASYDLLRDGETIAQALTKESYIDTNVSEGMHEYTIEVNYRDKFCDSSDAVSKKIVVKCTPVDNFVAEVAHGRIVRLSWELVFETYKGSKDIASFEILRDDQPIDTIRATTFSDREILVGESYKYTVVPHYDNGCVGDSVSATLTIDCAVPQSLDVTMIGKGETCTAELSWGIPNPTEAPAPEVLFTEQANSMAEMDLFNVYNGNASWQPKQRRSVADEEEREPSTNVLFDNGPFLTDYGLGADGADISTMYDGNYTRGWLASRGTVPYPTTVADDFVLTEETFITEIDFFAFMSPAIDLNSYITWMFLVIYDGDPSQGGRVIWGDLNTNRLYLTGFTGVYRVDPEEELFSDTTRPIMGMKAYVDIVLPAGEYWIEMSSFGSAYGLSGPWVIPVTIPGELNSGNGMMYSGGEWIQMEHSGAGGKAGVPFTIYGETVNRPVNIYCDGKLIAENVEGNSYTVENVSKGSHVWGISYLCGDDESTAFTVTQECTGTAIDEIDKTDLLVYPNPAKDFVDVKADATIHTIRLTSVSGILIKEVPQVNDTEYRLDLSNVPAGVYLLDADGKTVKVVKY